MVLPVSVCNFENQEYDTYVVTFEKCHIVSGNL